MTYGEVVTRLNDKATDLGLPFYHNTQDHVNEYQGDFPVVVLDPMPAVLDWPNTNVMSAVAKYEITLVFMDLIDPSSDRAEKQSVVEAQTQNAYNYVRQMADDAIGIPEAMHSIVRNARVVPYFTFNWNSHLTAGAILTFTWDTEPTWDCDSLTPAQGTRGNPYEYNLTGTANFGAFPVFVSAQANLGFDFGAQVASLTKSPWGIALTGSNDVIRVTANLSAPTSETFTFAAPNGYAGEAVWITVNISFTQA